MSLTSDKLKKLPDESSSNQNGSTQNTRASLLTKSSSSTRITKINILQNENHKFQDPNHLKNILDKTKQDRKNVFQTLQKIDKEKTNFITFTLFQQALTDNEIFLDEPTINYVLQYFCDKTSGSLNYRQIIKDLVIVTETDKKTGSLITKWHLKSFLQPKRRPISAVVSVSDLQDLNQINEMEAALHKILIHKNYNSEADKKIYNFNRVSASCPLLNLPKNNYNQIYLKGNIISRYIQQNKDRIRIYLRETNNLQFRTLQQMESCFLKCDKNRQGQVTRRHFILKLAKNNVKIPQNLLNNILSDIQLNSTEEPKDETILVYKHLIDIINIFQNCPQTLKKDRNQSSNFINSQEKILMWKTADDYTRSDLLLQHVNNRILEKHKGFTDAFRRFDKNFDGSLNFREFVQGMGELGINLNLADYRLIFDTIDYNEEYEIDYFKFCLLDYDKEKLRQQLHAEFKNNPNKVVSGVNLRFKDGKVPKNKDQHQFLEQCQEKNRTKTYLNKKLLINSNFQNFKLAKDLPKDHIFGKPIDYKDHNMQGVMTGSYLDNKQDKINKIKDDFQPGMQRQWLKPPKHTNAHIKRTNNIYSRFHLSDKRPKSAPVQIQFNLKEIVDQLWQKNVSLTQEKANYDQTHKICQTALKYCYQLTLNENNYKDVYNVMVFDEKNELEKNQIISLVRNLAKINGNETASSQKMKKSSSELNLQVKISQTLKQFDPNKIFSKREAQGLLSKFNLDQISFDSYYYEIDQALKGINHQQMQKLIKNISSKQQTTTNIQNLIKNALTPKKIQEAVESIWHQFDKQGKGKLTKLEAQQFLDQIIKKMSVKYSIIDFKSWFQQIDIDNSGTVDKGELIQYIQQLALTEKFGIQDDAAFFNKIQDGRHYIEKLISLYRSSALDYSSICDVAKKLFRCYDFDGSTALDKTETRHFLEALYRSMNKIGNTMSKYKFNQIFQQIDTDGSQSIQQDELVVLLCKIFKIEMPKINKLQNNIPEALQTQNDKIRIQLRKFAAKDNLQSSDQVQSVIRTLWQNYDTNGNGFLNKAEVKHFVQKHLKQQNQTFMSNIFEDWFTQLDKDGDGFISISEIANSLQVLINKL